MAAAAVFKPYELLDQTLLHLPLKDLLLCQRVCKQWQALVQRSQLARKALFLEPIARPDDQRPGDHQYVGSPYRPCRECPALLINPLFDAKDAYLVRPSFPERSHKLLPVHFGLVSPTNPFYPCARTRAEYMGTFFKAASWKSMLLTQPSPRRLVLACKESEPDTQYDLQASHAHGFRFGEVVEQLRAHWYECPNCPIQSREYYEDDPEAPVLWTLQVDGHAETPRSRITGWEVLEKLTLEKGKITRQGE